MLRNAVSLLRDARLLFKRRRYPRAYALSHLASEEMSKLPMLVRAGLESQVSQEYNWRKLEDRLHSHKSKLKSGLVLDFLLDPELSADMALRRLFEGLDEIDATNDLKNQSLYSGVIGDVFLAPHDVLSAETAREMIERSTRRLSAYLAAESVTRGSVLRATPERLASIKSLLDRLRNELDASGRGER